MVTAQKPTSGSNPAERYAAFISYSHHVDADLAAALQASLEQFARVWYSRRALRLFRDSTNLAATPHLWASLEEALAGSEWLILLASPESAKSVAVRREVEWWLTHRSAQRIIVVVTAGSVAWDEATGRVDEDTTDALPPSFAARELPEPKWVDLRALRSAASTEPVTRSYEAFQSYQSAIEDIAATLHGRPKDDLAGEQVRQQHRRRRWMVIAAALLVVFGLVTSFIAGCSAVERQSALDRLAVATARLLLTRAELVQADDPATALRLSETAYGLYPDPETRSALVQALLASRSTGALGGHTGSVTSVDFSRDGHTLASAGGDGVRLWDVRDPLHYRPLGPPVADPGGGVSTVAFSPDAHTLAGAGVDGTVRLWDVSDPGNPRPLGAPLSNPDPPGRSDASVEHLVAFSPDGHLLATSGGDATVRLWDVSDPTRAHLLDAPSTGRSGGVGSVAFSPDGRTVAGVTYEGGYYAVTLWDVTDPTHPRPLGPPLQDPVGQVYSMTFSPNGHLLAIAADRAVQLCDVGDLVHPRCLGSPLTGHDEDVSSAAFSPDGHTLAVAGGELAVRLWDVTDPAQPHLLGPPLIGSTDRLWSVAFAPDGHTVAAGGDDTKVRLWDLADPTVPLGAALTGQSGGVHAVAVAPDGRTLAGAGADKTVRLWDITDPSHPQPLGAPLLGHTGGVRTVAFSPNGHTLASAGDDQTVRLWNVADPRHPQPLGPPGTTSSLGAINAVAFSPDGRVLAAAGGRGTAGIVLLWDVGDPSRPLSVLDSDAGMVNAVAFSPDGHSLALAGKGPTVQMWDVDDPARPQARNPRLGGHTDAVYSVAYSPDGHTVASAGADHTVELWDLGDTAHPGSVFPPGGDNALYAVAFSPDGQTLASAGAGRTVQLWDPSTPAQPRALGAPLVGHTGPVQSVTFSPDGHLLVTAGDDGKIILWDLRRVIALHDHPLELACSLTGGGFDRERWADEVPGLDYQDVCAAKPVPGQN